MSQENKDKIHAALTMEVIQANDEAQVLHASGVQIASIARDPDQDGIRFTFELSEGVPENEEVTGVHGYQIADPPLPLNVTVSWLSPTLRQLYVVEGDGGSSGVDFHVDLTFYRRHALDGE